MNSELITTPYPTHNLQNPALRNRLKNDSYPKRILICPSCSEVKFKGVWYAPDSKMSLLIDVRTDDVTMHYCPACSMKHKGLFEGELNVYRVPPHLKDRVEQVVLQEVARLTAENPQHRLLSMVDNDTDYRLTTTAGPMVRRIGERIQSSFWTCDVDSKYFTKPHFLQQVNATFKTAEYF